MGCSNCGAAGMCDCPPGAGNSLGQDYAGLAQRGYVNIMSPPPESWDKKISRLVADKAVAWVASECYYRFESNDPFIYTAKLFKNKWGREETIQIFKKEREAIEDAVHQHFETEDSFLKALKKAL